MCSLIEIEHDQKCKAVSFNHELSNFGLSMYLMKPVTYYLKKTRRQRGKILPGSI